MTTSTTQEIAQQVAYFRKKSGLTQKELAHLAGVGKTLVFDIEKGRSSIQLNNLLKVLDVLNIKLHLETPIEKTDRNKP